ncbi:MAG: UDP-N-acetylmuramoyl-L-alanyl-D-glutamate--2,6-diaminopimelate ligase, partial [Bdellovibrionales bacterium]|nr:UDP-N-acetylmuramoyl-L-alanyl-D-glutamate--2,6-diaminopimelate ligase [Bdellovibrionales bacterium]
MRSSELSAFLECLHTGPDEIIQKLSRDSRSVGPKDIFFAIKGTGADGHDFLDQICTKGCLGVVVEQVERVPANFPGWVFQSTNIRKSWAVASQKFFGDPSQHLFVTGVTGTNGKTTTTHMIEWISNQLGILTGVIGTIDHHVGSRVWKTSHTTPDSFDLQGRLQDFISEGAKAASLEVTSHALDQFRTEGVSFDVGVFTNLTRDHLDYHVTMEKYFAAKSLLFQSVLEESQKPQVFAVINQDDPWGKKIKPNSR